MQDQQDQTDNGSTPSASVQDELPERLRVHSLARVLGTTSRRVLDALTELDGRSRSAQSSVDRTDAVRVRDVLTAGPQDGPAAETAVTSVVFIENAALDAGDEPESRLLLDGPEPPPLPERAAEQPRQADYLPLFQAPQPVEARPKRTADNAPADADDDDDDDDDDDAIEARDDSARDDSARDDSARDDQGDRDDQDGSDDDAERPANRRRRRGRRGRGRGRGGEGSADSDEDADDSDGDGNGNVDANVNENGKSNGNGGGKANAAQSTETSGSEEDGSDDDSGDDDETAGGDGATRRRRRRRRRKTGTTDDGDAASADDPPNTVVHERPPRSRSNKADKDPDEIQGISGSTRLEAKRQRRRDGRDAGRRRPPILSEAEFLARREAVERVMVVRDKMRTEPPHEGARYTQIGVLEDGVLVEHFVTSAASASLVGNIYLGIVQNVLPSMEAAFVDIGRGRNGVLYAGEVNWEAAGLGGAQRKIEQALKPGDYVVVQVSKDPVGHKGARLTTQVSLAGRYLVYVPGASSTGISRKLPDTERQRLKEILREVVPANAGVIIRTASEGVKEEDIRGDVTRLQERWNEIDARATETKSNAAGAAIALYEEPDVLVKVIRDLFNEDFSGLIVSGDEAWNTINEYVTSVAPELVPKMQQYDGGPDVFAVHRIDEQLAKAMDRKVWLPSGGTLVIDRTEAMTVVDVNTGKFTGAGGNLEQTVTKNNLEAAEETVRQLRLRDIGGMIVIDFIDMVLESNRDLVLRRLTEALSRDRTRHQVSEVTSLGLVQLTRKKLGTGLIEAFSTNCTHCGGRGIEVHADPVDSAPSQARKAEPGAPGGAGSSGSRRGKRGKKGGKADETPIPVLAKVPTHPAGEHPMFKAMAAAHDEPGADGLPEDAERIVLLTEDVLTEDVLHESVGEERVDDLAVAEQVAEEAAEEDLDDEDFDGEDSDDDAEETDEVDLEPDEDEDDDIDVVDLSEDSDDDESDEDDDESDDDDDIDDIDDEDDDDEEDDDDDDEDDDDDDDEDDDDEDDDDDDDPEIVVASAGPPAARVRRRAAARPAGPPR